MSEVSVRLGFVEENIKTPWLLLSKFFPSKVGGFPAWLRFSNLPNRSDITCSSCHKDLVFLMQIYAPKKRIKTAFHRTLFVFMCPSGKCSKRFSSENFVVLRSQLPRRNEFYSFAAPDYDEDEQSARETSTKLSSQFQTLCSVCGCSGAVKCKSCEIYYCSESHRSFDWEYSHQGTCGKENLESKYKNVINQFVLPEFKLKMEIEKKPINDPENSDEMKEYERVIQSLKSQEWQDIPMEDLYDVRVVDDKSYIIFEQRIKPQIKQVLRYQRGGKPLWISSEHVPSIIDIPDCSCGAERIFEFQVMPQMIYYLPYNYMPEGPDWGTLVVYTCSASCENATQNYVKEFLWKQEIS